MGCILGRNPASYEARVFQNSKLGSQSLIRRHALRCFLVSVPIRSTYRTRRLSPISSTTFQMGHTSWMSFARVYDIARLPQAPRSYLALAIRTTAVINPLSFMARKTADPDQTSIFALIVARIAHCRSCWTTQAQYLQRTLFVFIVCQFK